MIKQISNKKILFVFFIFYLSSIIASSQNTDEIVYSYLKSKAEFEYKNYKSALKNINNSIALNKNNYKNYILKGQILLAQNNIDQALKNFSKANELKNNSASYFIAIAYSKKKDWKNTDKYLRLYLKQKNKLPKTTVFLCKDFNEFSKTKYWKEIWKQDWYNKNDIFYQTITYMIKNEKYADALEELDKRINKKKKYKDLYYKALILYKLNDNKNAYKNINLAIKYSKKEELYILKGKILLKLDKNKKAVNSFTNAIKRNKYNTQAMLLLAEAYYKANKIDNAATTIEQYLQFYYKNDTALGLAGNIFYKKEEFFKSIKYFNKAIEINMKNSKYYEGRGRDFYITQSYRFAIKDFSVALDINPRNGEIYYLRGISYLNIDDVKNACIDWKNAMDNKYTDAYDYIRLNCQ